MTLNVVVASTSSLFSLPEAKAHLNVTFNDDDTLIGTYSDAAVAQVMQYCNISLIPNDANAVAAFKAAALIVLGDLYANRQSVMSDWSPIGRLLNPYRWLRI